MTKRKTIKRLEALMDALDDSKKVCAHNPIETEYIIEQLIDHQNHYKKLAGHYYDIRSASEIRYQKRRNKDDDKIGGLEI